MSKTVVGLYNDYSDAQAAVNDLETAGFARGDISLVANNAGNRIQSGTATAQTGKSHGAGLVSGAAEGAVIGGLTGLAAGLVALMIPAIGPVLAVGPISAALTGAGLGAVGGGIVGGLTGMGIPKTEAEYYAEGVRRGGTLVVVQTDDARAPQAVDILNRHNVVNIDERGQRYQQGGWRGYDANAAPYTPEQITTERQNFAAVTAPTTGTTATAATTPVSDATGERERTVAANESVTVPVVEEQLQVGKRQVQQGGARIHTRVTERPVEEQVTLREEHVTVDRHPVDRPVQPGDIDNALRERTIEVVETAEVPVVAKEARVVEEVTIGKTAQERTETVRDTVRRTDVAVEELNQDETLRTNADRVSRT